MNSAVAILDGLKNLPYLAKNPKPDNPLKMLIYHETQNTLLNECYITSIHTRHTEVLIKIKQEETARVCRYKTMLKNVHEK